MSLVPVGSATGTTTCTVPTHSIGDLIVIGAFRSGSTTQASLPAGYTSWRTQAGTACCGRVGYKIATATNDSSGTWTNATQIACAVYSGSGSAPNKLNNNSTSGTTSTITYPSLSGWAINNRSWVIGFVGQTATTSLATSNPTGMSNVVAFSGATASVAIHDTGGPNGSQWASANGTAGGAGNSVSFALELVDQPLAGWDPLNTGRGVIDTTAMVTLTGTDDITAALNSTGTSAKDFCGTSGSSSVKSYFEMTCVTQGTSDGNIGIEGSGIAIQWADSGNAPAGAFYNGAGTQVGSMTNATAGQTVGIAFDPVAGKAWFKNVSTGSQWNGTTDDPNTGTGGLTFTAGTKMYPAIGAATTGTSKWTLNTGGATFVGTIPTGFSTLYGTQPGGGGGNTARTSLHSIDDGVTHTQKMASGLHPIDNGVTCYENTKWKDGSGNLFRRRRLNGLRYEKNRINHVYRVQEQKWGNINRLHHSHRG